MQTVVQHFQFKRMPVGQPHSTSYGGVPPTKNQGSASIILNSKSGYKRNVPRNTKSQMGISYPPNLVHILIISGFAKKMVPSCLGIYG